jgi:hypothetical protein
VSDGADVIGADGRVRVLKHRCATCIFRPNDPMYLGADHTAGVIARNVEVGALLTCHATLSYGANPNFGPAVCNGFWSEYGLATEAGLIAFHLIGITHVEPPDPKEVK